MVSYTSLGFQLNDPESQNSTFKISGFSMSKINRDPAIDIPNYYIPEGLNVVVHELPDLSGQVGIAVKHLQGLVDSTVNVGKTFESARLFPGCLVESTAG